MEISMQSHKAKKNMNLCNSYQSFIKFLERFMFENLASIASNFHIFQNHLLVGLKTCHGKQQDMIVKGITRLNHPSIQPLFDAIYGDRSLKCHTGMLEKSQPNKKTTKEWVQKIVKI